MLRTSIDFLGLITHNQPVRQKHISQAALSMVTQHLSNHMHVFALFLSFQINIAPNHNRLPLILHGETPKITQLKQLYVSPLCHSRKKTQTTTLRGDTTPLSCVWCVWSSTSGSLEVFGFCKTSFIQASTLLDRDLRYCVRNLLESLFQFRS